jgi:enoyl-CoA hydratase/carnithine racemase
MLTAIAHENAHARVEVVDGVLTLTIDRQDKLNAISPEITSALWWGVERARDDNNIHAMVIQAVGRFFTAGIDLATGATGRYNIPEPTEPGLAYRRSYRGHHLLYDEFEALEKPVIIAAQGPCVGAGLEMAVSCDVRFAAPDTYFWLPEVGIGAIPGSGGISRLTRTVGVHWARWLAMLGQRVDANSALTMGLIHQIIPAEGFHDRVHEFAVSLKDLPAEAMGTAKLAIELSEDSARDTGRYIERIANTRLAFTEEHHKRIARFTK